MDAFPVSVNREAVEIREIANSAVGMPHPMHLHGFQFQVLSRQGSPAQVGNLAIDFCHNFAGEQHHLFHCHNLEHEDMGMMISDKVAWRSRHRSVAGGIRVGPRWSKA